MKFHANNNDTEMKTLYFMVMVVAILLFTECGGGKDNPAQPVPGVVSLSAPADNIACLKSTSTNGTSALVTLNWEAANNADSYQIDIKNLNLQITSSYSTNSVSYAVSLNVNTPYSWSVVAINSVGKTNSATWKFYLSGTPSSSYAPFPADLVTPTMLSCPVLPEHSMPISPD